MTNLFSLPVHQLAEKIRKSELTSTELCTNYIDQIKKFEPHKVRKIDLLFITKSELPWFYVYFGSDLVFARKIREYAGKLGYRLNEKGIFNRKTGKRINFEPKTEKEIFKFLGLDYIKPKDRPYITKLEPSEKKL